MPTAGNLGKSFLYNEIVIPPTEIEKCQNDDLLEELYVSWLGHFENVENNHAINRTLEDNVLVYVTNGHGYLSICGNNQTISPGSILFIAHDVKHTYGNQQGGWSGYWVNFAGAVSNRLAQLYFGNSYACFEVSRPNALLDIFSDLYQKICAGTQTSNLLFAANSLRYILSVSAQLQCKHEAPGIGQNLLEDIVGMMHQNLAQPIGLDKIACRAHLSQSQLIRFFRQQTGYTPMEYYNLLRMKEACNKMLHGEHNIKDIAYSLGFENQYYFSTVFRRTFGYSPTQFIQSMCPEPAHEAARFDRRPANPVRPEQRKA